MEITKQQIGSGLKAIVAVTEVIREAGEIPSGTLYAVLMDRFDIAAFDKMITIIVGTGLVEKRGDLLRWIGPEIAKPKYTVVI